MIQAAMNGQGIALGRQPLVNELIASGALAVPFNEAVVASRAYFLIESPTASGKPNVRRFSEWLLDEVRHESEREQAQ